MMGLLASLTFHIGESAVSSIMPPGKALGAIVVFSYEGSALVDQHSFQCVAEVKTMAWTLVACRTLRNWKPVCFLCYGLRKNGGALSRVVSCFSRNALMLTISAAACLTVAGLLLSGIVVGLRISC